MATNKKAVQAVPSACYCATVQLHGDCPVCGKSFGPSGSTVSVQPATGKLDRKALRAMGAASAKPVQTVQPKVQSVQPTQAKCPACTRHYGDGGLCDEGKPVNSPHRLHSPLHAPPNSLQALGQRRLDTMHTSRASLLHGPAHLALRSAVQGKDYNTATAILIGLAGGEHREARIKALAEMDAYGAEHGELTPAMLRLRKSLCDECILELGYNPRTHDAPGIVAGTLYKVEGAQNNRPTPPAYDASVKLLAAPSGPLKSGDWAELGRRVKKGEITEAEARAFGELWSGSTGKGN